MCGIFGICIRETEEHPCRDKLHRSAGLIGHRGPDAVGTHIDEHVALAQTRLSLLDPSSRSNQPLWDPTGRYCLIYNGEIYNFRVLRSELERRGVAFYTTSDTEVLLQCLIHDGVTALPRLEGMFAFAFYDTLSDTLLLSRDRFGIKPLFVYSDDKQLIFSSEIKAFGPWVRLDPDLLSISSFLQGFNGPTLGWTFYRNVRSVETGAFMRIQRGKIIEEGKFFQLTQFSNPALREELNREPPRKIVDRMEELLFTSVQKHMIADAQVGALCSGGVDSSLIMAMAAKIHKNLAIFHANVRGVHSEYDAARALAQHLRLDLNTVDVGDSDFLDYMAKTTYHYGHPFYYHPNSVPFLLVTQLVHSHRVKAVLTGEGADECFLGYSHLPTENLFRAYHRALNRARRVIQLIPLLGRQLWSDDSTMTSHVRGLHNRYEIELEQADTRRLLDKQVLPNDLKTIDLLGYHLRTLLHRNDALGMAASIEARFPFLDHDLVAFAVNLPYRHKIHPTLSAATELKHPFLRSKWVLRQVADRYLPRALSRRPKRGFPTNTYERMHISAKLFAKSWIAELFGLSAKGAQHLATRADQNLQLRLLHLEAWGRICLADESLEKVTSDIKPYIVIQGN